MEHVAIVGCGVVGAAIAYELSQTSQYKVTLVDQHPPAQGSTGAALGVLMGGISQKVKGNAWALRQASMQRYETLIPELEALTGRTIPFNRQGILKLYFDEVETATWQQLIEIRQTQGWQLEQWNLTQLQTRCPHISNSRIVGAIYSPGDRQVDPTALTLALVDAAAGKGVEVLLGVEVKRLEPVTLEHPPFRIYQIQTSSGPLAVDWVVLAAGLGTTPLLPTTTTPVEIRPVLGQAMRVRLESPLGDRQFQPVITGDDIHLVPLGDGEYWIGATVEFATPEQAIAAEPARLEEVWQGAISLCPELATAKLIKTWSGLRPRPDKRPAPVIERLADYSNVLLATGHYRNGVLLAPVTAQKICAMLQDGS
jgi:glycine oxidase